MKPMYIVLLGALIVALGTFLQNRASSKKSDKQLEKIQELNEMNIKLSTDLAENRKELADVRAEALNNTYGSEDVIFILGGNSGIVNAKFMNRSELPAYDIEAKITDYTSLLNCETYTHPDGNLSVYSDCFNKHSKTIKLSLLYGGATGNLQDYKVDLSHERKFSIYFHTKKGSYVQQYMYLKKGTAFRIMKSDGTAKYWNQFLEDSPDNSPIRPEKFSQIHEVNQTGGTIDWDSEFPLKPGIKFIK